MTTAIRPALHEKDLADWTEAELVALKEQAERRRKNYERIVRDNLVEGKHFGYWADDGEPDPALPPSHPYLFTGGAALLRELLRYTIRLQRDPIVVLDPMVTGVTVEVGVYRVGSTLLGVAAGHANTREGWLRRGPKDWKYDDAREVAPGLMTKAVSRAARNATLEAMGLWTTFASAEEHQRMYAEAPVPKNLRRWNDIERTEAIKYQKLLGIDNAAFVRKVVQLFGRPMVAEGEEARYLLDILEREVERKTRPASKELEAEMAA